MNEEHRGSNRPMTAGGKPTNKSTDTASPLTALAREGHEVQHSADYEYEEDSYYLDGEGAGDQGQGTADLKGDLVQKNVISLTSDNSDDEVQGQNRDPLKELGDGNAPSIPKDLKKNATFGVQKRLVKKKRKDE